MRSNPCDTVARFCARPVLCWLAFPSAPALGSTVSAADRSALFTGFTATTAGSDFSRSCIICFRFPHSPCRPRGGTLLVVRLLHSYYGGVWLLALVHHRLRLLTFPMRTLGGNVPIGRT